MYFDFFECLFESGDEDKDAEGGPRVRVEIKEVGVGMRVPRWVS